MKYTHEQIEQILKLRGDNWSYERIHNAVGIPTSTVQNIVEMHTERRPKHLSPANEYKLVPKPAPAYRLPNVTDPSLLRKITAGR